MKKWKLVLGAVAAVLLLALGAWAAVQLTTEKEDPVTTSVLEFMGSMQDIGELATAEYGYTLTQITDKESLKLLGLKLPFTTSKIIYSYSGQVKAGFSFSEITVDVDAESKTIRVTLPEAEILSSEVDFDSFQIYDERNSVFNPLTAEDFNQGLVEFKQNGEAAALEHGLLDHAAENAQQLLRTALAGYFDMSEYTVQFS